MQSTEAVEPFQYLIGHEKNVCALDSNYGLVVSGSWDATAKVWKDGSLLYTLKGHSNAVWAVKILSKSLVLTGSADKTVALWEDGKLKKVFKGHTDAVRGIAILSDTTFATCSNDASVRIWNVNNTSSTKELYGHTSFIYSIASNPTTGELVTGGEDRSVRVWRNGDVVQVITLPYVSAWTVSVNPENGDIAVGGNDGSVRIFTRDESRFASEEDRLHFKELVASSGVGKDQLGSINKESLEGEEGLKVSGTKEGQIKMIRTEFGKVEVYQWSASTWVKIGEAVGSAGTSTKKLYNGIEYDYVFDVDIEDGAPPLKLPYNVTENPYDAAKRFLQQNELPDSYLDNVANFLIKNTEGIDLASSSAPAQDPYGTRYIPGTSSASASTTDAGSSYSKSTENLKVLPVKNFVKLVSYQPAPIIRALKTINEKQEASNKISEAELKMIEDSLSSSAGISEQNASSVFTIVTRVLQAWSPSDILPIMDILRVIIPTLKSFAPVVLIQHLISTLDADLPKVCLLSIRGLVNLFPNGDPRAVKMIETESTKESIFSTVLDYLSKSNPTPARNLAISSLCYNYAVSNWKKGRKNVGGMLNHFVSFFPFMNDSESKYRLLLAIGTLLVDASSTEKKIAYNIIKNEEDLFLDEDRFKVLVNDLRNLIA